MQYSTLFTSALVALVTVNGFPLKLRSPQNPLQSLTGLLPGAGGGAAPAAGGIGSLLGPLAGGGGGAKSGGGGPGDILGGLTKGLGGAGAGGSGGEGGGSGGTGAGGPGGLLKGLPLPAA